MPEDAGMTEKEQREQEKALDRIFKIKTEPRPKPTPEQKK
jgi:hypothetical protein